MWEIHQYESRLPKKQGLRHMFLEKVSFGRGGDLA